MSDPLISVVVPVYNGRAFLADTIGSIVAQTWRNLEIVVVDDGSTDDSARLIEEWATRDGRIRPIVAPHGGAERARNIGVAAARGEYVAHLDHDNLAAPERLALQIEWMRAHDLEMCGSCTRVFGDAWYLRWVPERQEDILREYVFRPAMIHSTAMVAAAIAHAHPFREEITCGGEELLSRLVRQYRAGNLPRVLVKYRLHGGQRSRLERCQADLRAMRERYFYAYFADASEADYVAMSHVMNGTPFADAAEQRRAAPFMAHLSDTHDPELKRLMAERWAAATRQLPVASSQFKV
jgi:glycosyltransferase involved in cell wall biosynthesis